MRSLAPDYRGAARLQGSGHIQAIGWMGKMKKIVVLSMVLQFHNTIVLQGAELDGKVR